MSKLFGLQIIMSGIDDLNNSIWIVDQDEARCICQVNGKYDDHLAHFDDLNIFDQKFLSKNVLNNINYRLTFMCLK